MDIDITLTDRDFNGAVEIHEVNGPDIKAENDFGKTPVKTVTRSATSSGKTFRYRAAPHSFTLLKTRLT